jgi:D-3-phosphoglycerate dehydrogenase
VGYGRVGRMVAQYVSVFGARVQVSDPKVNDPHASFESLGSKIDSKIEATTLDHLLESSDLVTLHVNLNETTKGFFGRREFSRMKPGASFINTSRGELVDEAALLDALRAGRIAGAALDVLSGENSAGMEHHPLVQYSRAHANLLITPHIAGCTVESTEKTENFLAEQVVAFLQAQMEEALAHSVEAQAVVKERL